MAIEGIKQPEIININPFLRLRKYDGIYEFAYPWYQDEETVKLVDGLNAEIYDMEKLKHMYTYLNEQGELYYIEVMENGSFIPIGDVTFCSHDMPIVIGNQEYRGKGIGKAVVGALIERAKNLGYQEILVREIYSYNIASRHLFESFGFTKSQTLKEGHGYKLRLMRS